jgi:hypothetical protein
MIDLLKDIRSGALPVDEVPSFIFWLLGETFEVWFNVIVVVAVIFVLLYIFLNIS